MGNSGSASEMNEATLYAREADARMQFLPEGVRIAFPSPVSDSVDVRQGMGLAMQAVVFGRWVPGYPTTDVQELFRYIQNSVGRMFFGWSQAECRRRFYVALHRLWAESSGSGTPSLMTTARGLMRDGMFSNEEIVQQLPHWMFMFTGLGTGLLTRTLAMVSATVQDPSVVAHCQSQT